MNRIDILQGLIDRHGYRKYLEIGVNTPAQPGYSRDSIRVEVKHGIDPNVDTDFVMTSDDFFQLETVGCREYDLIFVDGDHTYEQAYRDVRNALKRLSKNGRIVMHDTMPTSRLTQLVPRQSDAWHGDVWKAVARLRLDGDVTVETIGTDEGCTVITPVPSDPWDMYRDAGEIITNLMTPEKWKENLP